MSDEKQQQTSTALVPALPPAPPESFQLTALQSWSDKVKTSGRGLLVTAAVVLGLVFGLGGYWSATAKIGGAVIVGGRVIAEGRNWVVQHLEGGILKSLAVREGDRVEAGALLAELDVTAVRSQLEAAWIDRAIYSIVLERWRAERDDLERFEVAEERLEPVADDPRVQEALESQRDEFLAARKTRLQQISVLEARIANEREDLGYLQDLLVSFDTQSELLRKEFTDLSALLEKGLTSRPRVFALQRELAKMDAQRSNALAAVQKSRHNIQSYEDQKQQILSEHAEQTSQSITDAQQKLKDVQDVIVRLQDRLTRGRILAPVAGTVFRVPVKSIGAVIKPGDTIVEILPEGVALQFEVPVEPKDIAQIFPGQSVDIVFPSDQADVIPPLRGEVSYISADAILDQTSGRSFYTVWVNMVGDDGGRTILPGNVAEVFFRTEPKTFLEYVMDPITRFAAKSFNG